jgi:hypothetical protein
VEEDYCSEGIYCLYLHFYPEDGGKLFHRNAGIHLPDYTALKNIVPEEDIQN